MYRLSAERSGHAARHSQPHGGSHLHEARLRQICCRALLVQLPRAALSDEHLHLKLLPRCLQVLLECGDGFLQRCYVCRLRDGGLHKAARARAPGLEMSITLSTPPGVSHCVLTPRALS
jgi:hypothetical protein